MSCSVPYLHYHGFAGRRPDGPTLVNNTGSGDVAIDEAKLKEIEDSVKESGVELGETSHSMGGWEGGIVWLVSTEKGIQDWKPIASRTL